MSRSQEGLRSPSRDTVAVRAARPRPDMRRSAPGIRASDNLECGRSERSLRSPQAAVTLPAMIEAADAIAFDPSNRELGAAVRAAWADNMRRTGFAAINGEVLSHDA